MTSTYPRETTEFLEVLVDVDGQPFTTFQVAVVRYSERPGPAWAEPVTLEGMRGVMVTGLDPGLYRIWAKVSDNPEVPVIDCGTFEVS